jgi:8-oxo-dGTP pyrophosphatase MutT (NUDIX family)
VELRTYAAVVVDPEVVERTGARVLVVDRDERVLLLRGADPADPAAGSWWITPGGGLDEGESAEEGARRELAEETGLRVDGLGPPVWVRTAEFGFLGRRYRQAETFFLLRVGSPDVSTSGWTDIERSTLQEHRWWTLDELARTEATVYPRSLPVELARLLAEGPPARPREVDP